MLVVLTVGAVSWLTKLNTDFPLRQSAERYYYSLPLSYRIERYYDMKTGTHWEKPSPYAWVFQKETQEFLLNAETLKVSEIERDEVDWRHPPSGTGKKYHTNLVSDPKERRELIRLIQKGINEAPTQRVPQYAETDYLVTATQGKERRQIEISFEGREISVENFESSPARDIMVTYIVLFDGTKDLPFFQNLARRKVATPPQHKLPQ